MRGFKFGGKQFAPLGALVGKYARPGKREHIQIKPKIETSMTPDRLREVLSYHPWTGEFRWKLCIGPRTSVGSVAGYVTDQGFVKISIDGRRYFAHRLAWLYMKRQWPTGSINHKNRKPADNRWPNLREATNSECQAYALSRRKGISRGVDCVDGGFRARVKVAGRLFNLGKHRTEARAYQSYLAVARAAFGKFSVE